MASIRDVSKLAGVSVATVSRTLSRPEKVKSETRDIVMKAVQQLGYQPNMLARNFRAKRAFVVLVIVPNIANPFFSRVLRGVEKVANEKGYAVLVGDTNGSLRREDDYGDFAATRQADGVIQLAARVPESLKPLIAQKSGSIPYVNACEFFPGAEYSTVGIDNAAAAKAMTEHLIGLGHSDIAIMTGPAQSPITEMRIHGFEEGMNNAGLRASAHHYVEGDYSLRSGKVCAEVLLASDKPPTAIMCFNDEMAIGALQTVRQKGWRVPEDISITGFDDISFAAYSDPPLTTLAQPTEEIGRAAMELLYNSLSGTIAKPVALRLPVTLITRDSSGPAPKST